MKIIQFLALLLSGLSLTTQPVERNFLDIEEISQIVENEVESMRRNPDFFYSYNLFYAICEEKNPSGLDTLLIDAEKAILYCKLIENSIPNYFLSILKISQGENNKVVQSIIIEFFKVYQKMHFDIDRIRFAKIFQSNVSILYRLNQLFELSETSIDLGIMKYLPAKNNLLNNKRISKINNVFVDFIVFKVLEKIIEFLYENPRLFSFTLFEMFEKPFEMVSYFNNDMEFITHSFTMRFHSRRLYLLDSLDNLALKSLNLFKNGRMKDKQIKQIIKTKVNAHDPYAQAHHDPHGDPHNGTHGEAHEMAIHNVHGQTLGDTNGGAHGAVHPHKPFDQVKINVKDEYGTKDISIVTPELLDIFEKVDYIEKDTKENEEGEINYKLINNCVRNSRFKSQSLEKIYCYSITKDVKQDHYLIETPIYNEKIAQIFAENSLQYESEFINLEASYFAEESIYNENIFPRFSETLDKAAEEFRRSIRKLRKEFYENHVKSIKQNFMYTWNRLVNKFWTETISLNEVSPETFQTNILNFSDFVDEIWFKRIDSDYFKLDSFFEKFSLRYKKNREKFGRYK